MRKIICEKKKIKLLWLLPVVLMPFAEIQPIRAKREELWKEGFSAAESKGVGPVSCACSNFQAKSMFSQKLPTAALMYMSTHISKSTIFCLAT